MPLSDTLVSSAATVRGELACSLYDALPAGLARLLHAPLYSADAKAHAEFPGVRIVGG